MSLLVKASQQVTLENFTGGNIVISENARLRHIVCGLEGEARATVTVGENAVYEAFFLQRNHSLELEVVLDSPGGSARIAGALITDGRQSDRITVHHGAPGTSSDLFFKGIATGHGSCSLDITTVVAEGLQNIEGYQLIKGLVLSDDASIHAKPELNIFSEDARCSHGCAIGTLDECQVFYMTSRGLPHDKAKRLLVRAFLEEVAGRLKDRKQEEKFLIELEKVSSCLI